MTPASTTVTGVCPVISAVFHPDGSVDEAGFAALSRHLMSTGINSVMVFGVATENAKLSDDERDTMLQILVRERANQDVMIIATVADHATELATKRVRRWRELGADMINVLPSRFLDPPRDQALAHLSAVLQSSDIPMIIQFLPQAGIGLPLADIVELAMHHANLQQIKVEEIPAAPAVAAVLQQSLGNVTPLVGWGGLEWQEAIRAGAVGVQPGCSLTEVYLRAQERLDANDDEGFADAFAPLSQPLRRWMRHIEVLIAMEKHVLMRRGIIASDRCRNPSATLEFDDYTLVDDLLPLVTQTAGSS